MTQAKKNAPPPPRASRTRGGAMKCRVCDCTQERGCSAGCGWEEDGLCTVCAELQDLILGFCAASPLPVLSVVLTGLRSYVVDDLEDADDLRTRRGVFDLLAHGFLVRGDRRGYHLTQVGRQRRAAHQRRASRGSTGLGRGRDGEGTGKPRETHGDTTATPRAGDGNATGSPRGHSAAGGRR